MATILQLKTKQTTSRIIIGRGILNSRNYLSNLHAGEKCLIITNTTIYKLYCQTIKKIMPSNVEYQTLVLPDREEIKSISYYIKIINKACQFGKSSDIYFMSLGGGVISDLTGFAASTFRRGILCVHIPTSLLAQVDAAIGGKTAIDTQFAKNIIGTFWQPHLVLIDINFLKTLSWPQFQEGFAEILKYGLIKDPKIFNYLKALKLKEILKSQELTEEIITRCVKIKKTVVEQDPEEKKGIRTILNFGHTIGHAIETASQYKISHGHAVIWGILAAIEISKQTQTLSSKNCLEIEKRVRNAIKNAGFSLRKKSLPPQRKILKAMLFDKKFKNSIRMVLIEKIGKVKVIDNIPVETIKKSLKACFA